jgi:pullulanase
MFHLPNNLSQYNLFRNPNCKYLKTALLTDSQTIKLELFDEIDPGMLSLFRYNYDKENQNGTFELISEEYISYDLSKKEIKITPNIFHNYCIHYKKDILNVIFDPKIGGILDTVFAPENDFKFGVLLDEQKAEFRVWSPPAGKISLILFDKNQDRLRHPEINLQKQKTGIWTLTLHKNDFGFAEFNELYYQYEVFAYGKKMRALDPYSKSMAMFTPSGADKIGKGAIISEKVRIKPKFKNSDILSSETQAVIYEINVRDFTIQPGTVEKEIAGTYAGFEKKTEYLKTLGISHVQLMPVLKSYTQYENDCEYTGRKSPISKYNWGYDTMNFFTPEGRYSTNPENPYNRIDELQHLTQTLHQNQIGIIFDVVYNHAYLLETFENIAPGCYFRHNSNGTVSEHTGAGATLESRRPIVRKLMSDSMKHLIQTYDADGFRFDLMSFHDIETMEFLRNEIGKFYNSENIYDLILHGEAWNFTDLPEKTAYTKINLPEKNLHISLFNDVFRDAAVGRNHKPGFVQGDAYEFSNLGSGIAGAVKSFRQENLPFDDELFYSAYSLFARSPEECLNYLAIHDGLTLWDKIHITSKNSDKKARLKIAKLAAAILFTSQGKVIWHGGDEILRSKPLAEHDLEKNRALTFENIEEEENSKYFHENSYQSPDFTNEFRWDRLNNKFAPYSEEMKNYVSDLINLRNLWPAFRFRNAKNITNGLQFIAENKTEAEKKIKFYHFTDDGFNKLIIRFINGPKNEIYYLSGEIHAKDANPEENPFRMEFDSDGKTEIYFTREQILNFDLKKWDNSRRLNFKLTQTPGAWNFPAGTYSSYGFNSICPSAVDANFTAEIDLRIKDFWRCNETSDSKRHIVFLLNNTIEKSEFTKKKSEIPEYFLVIYNSDQTELKIEIPEHIKHRKLLTVGDENTFNNSLFELSGVRYIENTNVKITENNIIVPKISATLIAVI